jgi:hypothetical protein
MVRPSPSSTVSLVRPNRLRSAARQRPAQRFREPMPISQNSRGAASQAFRWVALTRPRASTTGVVVEERLVAPNDSTGVCQVETIRMTADDRSVAFEYDRSFDRLLLIDGLLPERRVPGAAAAASAPKATRQGHPICGRPSRIAAAVASSVKRLTVILRGDGSWATDISPGAGLYWHRDPAAAPPSRPGHPITRAPPAQGENPL